MAQLIEIFGESGFTPPPHIKGYTLPPDQQMIQVMLEHGLEAPNSIVFDGHFHRFGRKKSGWYVAFAGEVSAGKFGDWREGIEANWRQDMGRELSVTEKMAFSQRMADAKRIRDAEIAALRENAAHQADDLWESGQVASDDHPYLAKKNITNISGMKVAPDGRLMAPCYFNGEISGLQYIDSDGGKLWMKGSKSGGAYWHIGNINQDGTIYIAEGIATATSVHQATGCPVIIAFSAQNIPIISKNYSANLKQKLIIVADNDASGTGEKCAKDSGLPYFMPPTVGMDANDYVNSGGDLYALLNPVSKESWLVNAVDWSAQPASINWMVKRWLQKNALIMVHGPSGGGKTFVVLDWCLRLAAGMDEWCGHKIHSGNVVYLAGEGHHGLRGRIAAWRFKHGVKSVNMWLSKGGCDLNTNGGYNQVVDSIKQLGIKPDLIVVDTLHRFLAGDENSAQDAKTMLDACNGLMSEFECSSLLVHHTGVSDEAQHRARGSSAWRGALDIEISVVPATASSPMQVVQRKSKDAEIPAPIWLELEQVAIPGWIDEDGEQVTSAVVVQSEQVVMEKEKPRSKALKLFIDGYKAAGNAGVGVYAGGEFVGVDLDTIREQAKELSLADGMTAGAFRGAYKRALDEVDRNMVTITGSCWFFQGPEFDIFQSVWDKK